MEVSLTRLFGASQVPSEFLQAIFVGRYMVSFDTLLSPQDVKLLDLHS